MYSVYLGKYKSPNRLRNCANYKHRHTVGKRLGTLYSALPNQSATQIRLKRWEARQRAAQRVLVSLMGLLKPLSPRLMLIRDNKRVGKMFTYFRGAICRTESGAPVMVYVVIQKHGARTRTIRITMGQKGYMEFHSQQAMSTDMEFYRRLPGHYYANNVEQLGITLGDLEMRVYDALKEGSNEHVGGL